MSVEMHYAPRRVPRKVQPSWVEPEPPCHEADHDESQAEIIRSAKESAWAEGHQAGRLDEYCLDTNPYRSQA